MGRLFSVCYGTRGLISLLFPRSSRLSSLKILLADECSIQDFILNVVIQSFQLCHQSVDFFFVCLRLGGSCLRDDGGVRWLGRGVLRLSVGRGFVGLFGAFPGHVPLYLAMEASSFFL